MAQRRTFSGGGGNAFLQGAQVSTDAMRANTDQNRMIADTMLGRERNEVARGQLDLGTQQLAQQGQQFQEQQKMKMAVVAKGELDTIIGVLSEAAKVRGPEAAASLLAQMEQGGVYAGVLARFNMGSGMDITPEQFKQKALALIGVTQPERLNVPATNRVLEMTPGGSLREIVGAVPPKDPPLEVGDSTSPTGSRFVPASQAVGMPGRPREPLMTAPPLETSFSKGVGEGEAKAVNQMNDEARIAYRNLDSITQQRAAIESGRFQTGAFADWRLFAARTAQLFGAPEEVITSIGDAETADVLDSAMNRMAVNEAGKLSRVTNLSLGFIKNALPNLMRTPEGNKVLNEVMERAENRKIQLAAMANEYAREHKTLNPKGVPSFAKMQADLEKADPVISPELYERIADTSKKSPKSLREALEKMSGQPPAGFAVPAGYSYVGSRGGKAILRRDADGQEFTQQ